MARRVLLVSPGTGLGGGEVSLLTLLAGLDQARYEPTVLAFGEGRFTDAARNLTDNVAVRGYSGLVGQAGFVAHLASWIAGRKIDIVHVNTLDIRAGLAAKAVGRRLVGHLRVIYPTTWVDAAFTSLADRTIAVSGAVRDWFCREQGVPFSRFAVIHNAVDTGSADDPGISIRSELGLPPGCRLAGVVGRIDPWKGQDVFLGAALRIADAVPDVHFLLVGEPGPAPDEQAYADTLRRLAAPLGSRIHFLGFRRDALRLIRDLDVLVVPSLVLKTAEGTRTEGFGRVAAEGLAVGTPVIASSAGGLPEIIQHDVTGRLVPPGSVDALGLEMVAVLESEHTRTRLATAGRRRFESCFTVERHLHSIQSLYDELLND